MEEEDEDGDCSGAGWACAGEAVEASSIVHSTGKEQSQNAPPYMCARAVYPPTTPYIHQVHVNTPQQSNPHKRPVIILQHPHNKDCSSVIGNPPMHPAFAEPLRPVPTPLLQQYLVVGNPRRARAPTYVATGGSNHQVHTYHSIVHVHTPYTHHGVCGLGALINGCLATAVFPTCTRS